MSVLAFLFCQYAAFIIIIYFLRFFFTGRLSDSKSLQVSRSFLGILADLNNVAVRMVSVRPPTSIPSSLHTKPLEIVPSTPITIGITVTLIFHFFKSSLTRFKYLYLLSFSLIFALFCRDGKVFYSASSRFFFLLIISLFYSYKSFSHQC